MRQIETGHYPINFQTLPSSWAVVSVGEALSEIQPGFACGIHNRDGIGIPHIRPMNIDRTGRLDLTVLKYVSAENELRLHSGDVLFNNTNSAELIGKTTYIGIDAELAFSNHMTRLRPANGVDSRFIAYQLHFLWMMGYFQQRCTHHVNQASVASSTLADSVPLIIAPTVEQRHIVAEIEKQFTRLDAAVVALKRVQANLKRYRASVLKAACEGCLAPTEAELARRERRSYEPASLLVERVLTERRALWEATRIAKFKASGKTPTDNSWKTKYPQPVGPDIKNAATVPEGWIQVSWSQIGFSQNGRLFPSGEYCDQGIKLLRPGNLYSNGTVGWTSSNTRHLPEKWASDFPEFIIAGEELVMNLTAQSLKDEFLGRACLTRAGDRCLLNQRIARLKPVLIQPRYLLYVFKSQLFRLFVNGLNTGSLIQHMFTSQLDEFVFPLPPLEEQKRIVEEVEKRLSVIERIETQTEADISRAEYLRKAILKNAFQGRLVPKDSSDEPASALLERIRAERQDPKISRPHVPKRRTKEVQHVG